MAINTEDKFSPGWWLEKAFAKRAAKLDRLKELKSWHDGKPPAPQAVQNAREAFREFEAESTTNYAELITESLRERISVREIRTALSASDADEEAWKFWLDNNLDVEFSTLVETFLWAGDAYAIVGEDDEEEGAPIVTPEDPRDVVTFHDPIKQSRLRAGAKFLFDPDEGKDFVFITVAGKYVDSENAVCFVAERASDGNASNSFDSEEWSWSEEHGGAAGEELRHKLVPFVRLRNRNGKSEFEPHLPIMRRINRYIFQLSVIIMYQAYKQRAILADVDDPEETAKDDLAEAAGVDDLEDVLTSDPGSWFLLPAGTKIWESSTTDVQGLLKAISDDERRLAAVSRRPMAMFTPDNQSAEGAKFTREGLTFGVEDKQNRLERFLVDVFYLIFLTVDDKERAVKSGISVGFMPASRYTITDKASAASQVASVLPLRTILREIWQMTPSQIAVVEGEQADQALLLNELTDDGEGSSLTLDQLSKAAEALGRLTRSAVTNESAAEQVGLTGLKFNDGRSTSLKFPDE
ncbi:phage portal protein [Leucobacter sp. cx-42]|uniref:phage portal protein n=1 Tax=unclassified Leucobacter TaxID=2621730 RepID=UPI00165D4427|nr:MULTISPECIES: phage portal protein [unclassified Leucobacter]MBC9954936.1 phage portal protein [Leucobacter sp. cx-42]